MKLRDFGFRPGLTEEVKQIESKLTFCQMVVVLMSIISVVFLFVPLFYLQEIWFVAIFFAASFISLTIGITFWVKQSEICEQPHEVQD
jgi:uncharacterized membrane protein